MRGVNLHKESHYFNKPAGIRLSVKNGTQLTSFWHYYISPILQPTLLHLEHKMHFLPTHCSAALIALSLFFKPLFLLWFPWGPLISGIPAYVAITQTQQMLQHLEPAEQPILHAGSVSTQTPCCSRLFRFSGELLPDAYIHYWLHSSLPLQKNYSKLICDIMSQWATTVNSSTPMFVYQGCFFKGI